MYTTILLLLRIIKVLVFLLSSRLRIHYTYVCTHKIKLPYSRGSSVACHPRARLISQHRYLVNSTAVAAGAGAAAAVSAQQYRQQFRGSLLTHLIKVLCTHDRCIPLINIIISINNRITYV